MYTVKVWHEGAVKYYKCESLISAQFLVEIINKGKDRTNAIAEIL